MENGAPTLKPNSFQLINEGLEIVEIQFIMIKKLPDLQEMNPYS